MREGVKGEEEGLRQLGNGSPGGPGAKNTPANAGGAGAIPGQGGSHTCHGAAKPVHQCC